jgi:hypothetical protein
MDSISADALGPVYTRGDSFRARAEARQREYRVKHLAGAGWSEYGHLLDEAAADAGRNFVTEVARAAAIERRDQGKGVAPRTFDNMLSSQAMCFNLFAPLRENPDLGARVLQRMVPGLRRLAKLEFEHTPAPEVFGDQTGSGGVDCDLLIEAELDGGAIAIITVETKFVETGFSICGFRKPGRAKKERAVCPEDVAVNADHASCLYASRKQYRYWERSDELATLRPGAIDAVGCPFAGGEWQLWVNHTLAHAEAKRAGADRALFLVCAPEGNAELLGKKRGPPEPGAQGQPPPQTILDQFSRRLVSPTTFGLLPLDKLLGAIATEARTPGETSWARALALRYGNLAMT